MSVRWQYITCSGDGLSTECDATPGQSNPEVCNDIDDDCDGSTDETLTQGCGSDVGECVSGTQTCSSGSWGVCAGEVVSSAEVCDGLDNDCDGATDENFLTLGDSCTEGLGACQSAGNIICSGDGLSTQCDATPSQSSPEACNNIDDDCDGSTDEGLTQSCGSDVGECEYGTQTCSSGSWGVCAGEIVSSAEVCDGLDNNCDGSTDENFPTLGDSCTEGLGACQSAGNIICSGDGQSTQCDATPGQSSPETCNNIDDNCDGSTDEGLTQSCGSDVGECEYGTQTCSSGSWGTCVGEVASSAEVCDGLDNDCNGLIDEGGETLCDDSDSCTLDSCDPTLGCQHTQISDCGSCPEGGQIYIHADKHYIPKGSNPSSTKEPYEGLTVGVYDKSDSSCVRTYYGVSWQNYHDIVYGDVEATPPTPACDPMASGVTDENGELIITLPPGDYIVIGTDETGLIDKHLGVIVPVICFVTR